MLMRFKQLTLSLCLLGVSAASWSQAVLVKTEKNIEEYKLDNGFRIILAPNDKENKIFMNTVYMTGSLNDPQGKGGLAHLLEHLAFKGTQNVKGEEFQRRLEAVHERILGDMLVESVVSGAVSDQAVERLYQEQQRRAQTTEEVRVRLILSHTKEQADADADDDVGDEHRLAQAHEQAAGQCAGQQQQGQFEKCIAWVHGGA